VIAEAYPNPNPHSRLELAVRDGGWKLRLWREGEANRCALYDLAHDPGGRRDVSSDHPEVVQRLRAVLSPAQRAALEPAPRGIGATALDPTRPRDGDSSAPRYDASAPAGDLERLRALGYTR
jgi:hypothetical protein